MTTRTPRNTGGTWGLRTTGGTSDDENTLDPGNITTTDATQEITATGLTLEGLMNKVLETQASKSQAQIEMTIDQRIEENQTLKHLQECQAAIMEKFGIARPPPRSTEGPRGPPPPAHAAGATGGAHDPPPPPRVDAATTRHGRASTRAGMLAISQKHVNKKSKYIKAINQNAFKQ